MSVASLRESEISLAIEALAKAFRDNALNRAVIRSDDPERRLRSNRHGMRSLLPVAIVYGRVLVASCEGSLAGALVASPPNAFPLPPPGWVPRLRGLMAQGWQVTRRWSEVFDALELLHPMEPHWYLGTLGVDPDRQSRGVGTALLSRWLAEVDRGGMPAYLETDSEGNVGFYQRLGFAVESEVSVLGVPVWTMCRRAARRAAMRGQ